QCSRTTRTGLRPRPTASWPRRCWMVRRRASMREGPLAELFRATESGEKQEPEGTRAEEPPPDAEKPHLRPVEEPPPEEEPRPQPRAWQTLLEPPARLHRSPRREAAYLAVIRVAGVGGAGINAVNRMIDSGIADVDFVAVNTDVQQLRLSDAATKIHIGEELTRGLGSGADSDVGRRAAEEAYDQVK